MMSRMVPPRSLLNLTRRFKLIPETSHRRRLAITLAALLVATMASSTRPAQDKTSAARTPKGTIVFVVSGHTDDTMMDAVVLVEGRKLREPYTDEQKNDFGKQYWATGKDYRLLFGGGEAGTVRVDSWGEGCNNIHAMVTAKTKLDLGKVAALATNSDVLGRGKSSRRALTAPERKAMLALMKRIYNQHRTPAALMREIKSGELVATDLYGDGNFEFIGDFAVAAKNKFERDLFLIARMQGAGMRAEFVKFQAYQPPPEGFLSAINFLDQLDLDGDGVAEVFAEQGGFDGYEYLIFKKVNGRWRQVYEIAGDAC